MLTLESDCSLERKSNMPCSHVQCCDAYYTHTYILHHTNMHLFIDILCLMNGVVDDTGYLLNICLKNA